VLPPSFPRDKVEATELGETSDQQVSACGGDLGINLDSCVVDADRASDDPRGAASGSFAMRPGSVIAPPAGGPWRVGSMATARFMVLTMDSAIMTTQPAPIAGPFSAHGRGEDAARGAADCWMTAMAASRLQCAKGDAGAVAGLRLLAPKP
jgi:hypothetical protein